MVPCKTRVGAGLPEAVTVNAMATCEVAPYGPVPLVNAGAVDEDILYNASFCWVVV